MSLTDEQAMARFKAGDRQAFRILLSRHERRVFSFYMRSFRDEELARDLTQEVFLRVVRARESFEARAKFTTWMWRIARNLQVDTLRRLQFRRHASLDAPIGGEDEGTTKLERVADEKDQPADRGTEDRRFTAALAEAVPKLEDEQREVFLLRTSEGLSFGEIAEIQDVSVNTVKSRMRYALLKLRAELASFAPNRGTS